MKKKRARSKQQKAIKFQEIIDKGRELFTSQGLSGFSMNSLAKKLKMAPSSLYNYVESKRELWYAIIKADYLIFDEQLKTIINTHQGLYIDLLIKLGEFYLNFSRTEPERFLMMFSIPAPPSKSMGPIENSYKITIFPLRLIENIIQKAIKENELAVKDVNKHAVFLWSTIHGCSMIINYIERISIYYDKLDKTSKEKIIREIHQYILDQLHKFLIFSRDIN